VVTLERSGMRLNPTYLKETVDLIRNLSSSSRVVRRSMYNFWLNNKEIFQELTTEQRKLVLGHEMSVRGFVGFELYTNIGELADIEFRG